MSWLAFLLTATTVLSVRALNLKYDYTGPELTAFIEETVKIENPCKIKRIT